MITNLQALRYFAAIAVVFVHVCSSAGLGLPFGFGAFGVDVFFVISGFTIAYVGTIPAGPFVVRRLVRIVPFYWTASVGTYLIARLAPGKVQSSSADVGHLLYSLFFVPHANAVGNLDPILALGWSLNYEMYFYALFAIALLVSIRWAPIVCSGLLVLVTLAIRASGTDSRVLLFYADPIVFEFVLGIGVHYLVRSDSVRDWLAARPRLGPLVLVGLMLVSVVMLPVQEVLFTSSRALRAGPWSLLLVASTILLERTFGRRVERRFVLLLGDASYVLYLTHPYVVYGIIRIVLVRFSMGTITTSFAIVGLLAVATAIAVAIHVWFERPVMAVLRRWLVAPPRPPPRPSPERPTAPADSP